MNFAPLTHGDYDFTSDPVRKKMMQDAVDSAPQPENPGDSVDVTPGNPWGVQITSETTDGTDGTPASSGGDQVATSGIPGQAAQAAQAAGQGIYGPNTFANTLGVNGAGSVGDASSNQGGTVTDQKLQQLLALITSLIQAKAGTGSVNGAASSASSAQAVNPQAQAATPAATGLQQQLAATAALQQQLAAAAKPGQPAAPASAAVAAQPGLPVQAGAPVQPGQPAAQAAQAGRPATPGQPGKNGVQTAGGQGTAPQTKQTASAGAVVWTVFGPSLGDPATAAAIADERGNGWTKGTLSY